MRIAKITIILLLGLIGTLCATALTLAIDDDSKQEGPECMLRCTMFDISGLKPGGTKRGNSNPGPLRFRLADNGGQSTTLKDSGDDSSRENLKYEFSAKTHGAKFPVEVDLLYTLEANGRPKLKIAVNRAKFMSDRDSILVVSEDGNHILVASFSPWPDPLSREEKVRSAGQDNLSR